MKYDKAGVVESINGPAEGPASAITYNVRINLPGSPNLLFSGVAPEIRWPEDVVDTVATRPGVSFDVRVFGTDYYFDIPELPKLTPCP